MWVLHECLSRVLEGDSKVERGFLVQEMGVGARVCCSCICGRVFCWGVSAGCVGGKGFKVCVSMWACHCMSVAKIVCMAVWVWFTVCVGVRAPLLTRARASRDVGWPTGNHLTVPLPRSKFRCATQI